MPELAPFRYTIRKNPDSVPYALLLLNATPCGKPANEMTLPAAIKTATLAFWLVLFGLLVQREVLIKRIDMRETTLLAHARENHYYGIWHNQQRIGYVAERTKPESANQVQIQLDSELHLSLPGERSLPLSLHLTGLFSPAKTLNSLNGYLTCAAYTIVVRGEMRGETFQLGLLTSNGTMIKQFVLPAAPLLPLGQQPQLMTQLPKPGDKAIRTYPALMVGASAQSVIRNLGEEKLLVNNRIDNLMHFNETFNGIELHYWLNQQGKIVKTTIPGGLTLQAEPEFLAKAITLPTEKLAVFKPIPLDGSMPAASTRQITYQFTPAVPNGWNLAGGRQQVHGGLLTLRLENLGDPAKLAPCDSREHLEPIPHDFPGKQNARDLAKAILKDETSPANQVQRLAEWTRAKAMAPPPAALPDLLSFLATQPEHHQQQATAFAALARAAGIPAAIVSGLVLQQQAFIPQTWNEVCLNGGWVSLDTAAGQFPADLTHIRIRQSGPPDGSLAAGLPANLRIAVIEEHDDRPATH